MATSCGIVRLVPGPRGAAGTDGTDGTNGQPAYTLLTAAFTMPAEGATAPATVGNTDWLAIGALVWLQGAGTLRVSAITDATNLTLYNLEDSGTGEYANNAAPGTVIAIGNKLVAAGMQGPGGTAAAGALLAANNLIDVADVATSRNHLGLGTAATQNVGVASGEIAPNDGALTTGQMVRATAAGIDTPSDADARTALGLGDMAVQSAAAVAITGGTMIGMTTIGGNVGAATLVVAGATSLAGATTLGNKLFTPASSLQSLSAASAINPNSFKIRVDGSGGAVVLTSTPSITNPAADGQLLLIQGAHAANTVTLQDESSLAGTQLELGAATRVLGLGDTILLNFDLTTNKWYEVAFTNN